MTSKPDSQRHGPAGLLCVVGWDDYSHTYFLGLDSEEKEEEEG